MNKERVVEDTLRSAEGVVRMLVRLKEGDYDRQRIQTITSQAAQISRDMAALGGYIEGERNAKDVR